MTHLCAATNQFVPSSCIQDTKIDIHTHIALLPKCPSYIQHTHYPIDHPTHSTANHITLPPQFPSSAASPSHNSLVGPWPSR
mmetsp:Transcript_45587/g.128715  ORF Transcript_45587/g.128715 Transcript_45587/m.128715 type:complete len:82 (+) Transcript_45587:1332-1577(+)